MSDIDQVISQFDKTLPEAANTDEHGKVSPANESHFSVMNIDGLLFINESTSVPHNSDVSDIIVIETHDREPPRRRMSSRTNPLPLKIEGFGTVSVKVDHEQSPGVFIGSSDAYELKSHQLAQVAVHVSEEPAVQEQMAPMCVPDAIAFAC